MAMDKKPISKGWLGVIVGVALLLLYTIITYNGFISKEEAVTKTWNNLQSNYQRRADLIPNLVNAVKGSTDYEKETLTKLIESRAAVSAIKVSNTAPTADEVASQEQTNAEMVTAANRVIGVIEKYPDLKSTNAFVKLQDQLVGSERRVKFARKDFNDAVMTYNKSARSFPSSIIASIFGFAVKDGFKADAGAETAPEIKF
jgi:LemA protein